MVASRQADCLGASLAQDNGVDAGAEASLARYGLEQFKAVSVPGADSTRRKGFSTQRREETSDDLDTPEAPRDLHRHGDQRLLCRQDVIV